MNIIQKKLPKNPGFVISKSFYRNNDESAFQMGMRENKKNIHKYLANLLTEIPAYIDWKNIESIYLGCSQMLAIELARLKSSKDINGRTDDELIWGKNATKDYFLETDNIVLSSYIVYTLSKLKYFNQSRIVLIKKIPFFSKNDVISGIISYVIPITNPSINNILNKLKVLGISISLNLSLEIKKFVITNEHYNLSYRQRECLLYLLRGASAKEIAKILDLSYRTVEFYLESLRDKFKCSNKTDLIIKAIQLGYLDCLS